MPAVMRVVVPSNAGSTRLSDLVRAQPTRWLFPAVAAALALQEDGRARSRAEWEAVLDRVDRAVRAAR